MSAAVFVTGTDTGCGKTAVACAIARAARAAGLRVRVMKPVETGCEPAEGSLHAADAMALAHAAADDSPLDRICPYRLRLAAAPSVAARAEGVAIDPTRIHALCESARAESDLLIVEGAGGLLVPLTQTLDMAELARILDLPLVVVARATLGTINHTRLTLEAAHARGLDVLGLVVSQATPCLCAADRANLDELQSHLSVALLGILEHAATDLSPSLDARALAQRASHFDRGHEGRRSG